MRLFDSPIIPSTLHLALVRWRAPCLAAACTHSCVLSRAVIHPMVERPSSLMRIMAVSDEPVEDQNMH